MNKDLFDNIINSLRVSDKSIINICKDLNSNHESFYQYLRSNKEALEIYAQAKIDQSEFLFDKIHDLEEEMLKEVRDIVDPKRCNSLQAAWKVKIDNLKWILSKLLPMKFGDRLDLTTGGKDLPGTISVSFVDNKEAKPAK